MFASFCADFEAKLVEFDGEDDHIHLLVNYPPKVSVSELVNSLKGVSSRMIRKNNYPSIRKKLWGGALWSPRYFAGSCWRRAHYSHPQVYRAAANTFLDLLEQNGFAVRALDPALKDEVCRAPDQYRQSWQVRIPSGLVFSSHCGWIPSTTPLLGGDGRRRGSYSPKRPRRQRI